MKKITGKLLILVAVFAIMMVGGSVFAEEVVVEEETTARERVDLLMERIEELSDLIVEMKEKGDLPLVEDDIKAKEAECEEYITEYITFGVDNTKEEVEKLQVFLNEEMGTEIPVTGFYGEITVGVLKDFQVKYTEDILAPWGTTRPTGQVYKTTRAKINDIMCPDVSVPAPDIKADLEERESAEEVASETEDTEEGAIEDTYFPLEGDEDEEDEEAATTGMVARGNGSPNYLPIMIIAVGLIGMAAILYHVYAPKKQKKGKMIH